MAKYQTDEQRISGFHPDKTREISYRRRSHRVIEVVVCGQVVTQIELYATDEGFFVEGRNGARFRVQVA